VGLPAKTDDSEVAELRRRLVSLQVEGQARVLEGVLTPLLRGFGYASSPKGPPLGRRSLAVLRVSRGAGRARPCAARSQARSYSGLLDSSSFGSDTSRKSSPRTLLLARLHTQQSREPNQRGPSQILTHCCRRDTMGSLAPIVIETGGECEFTDPEQFLNRLSPRDQFWRGRPSDWIFRGQDGDWPLLPKAYRDRGEAYGKFGRPCFTWGEDKAKLWNAFQESQRELLKSFREKLDKSGLAIPLEPPDLFERGRYVSTGAHPEPPAFPQLALAQHLGLPTSLLDWTTRPLVAAYFAGPKNRPLGYGKLVIWALRRDFIRGCEQSGVNFGAGEVFTTIETAPRSSNPNLHAQAGLFTLVRSGQDSIPLHDVTIDDYVQRAAEVEPDLARYGGGPLMRKLTLPISQSPRLLRLLADEGIDASTMFPGYDGIVKSMTEETLWSRK
jgi:hypothetical protein